MSVRNTEVKELTRFPVRTMGSGEMKATPKHVVLSVF